MKIEKKALKTLQKMPLKKAQQFYSAFKKIEQDDIKDLDIKKMSNSHYSRLRIGDYRAIYSKDFELIVILVGSRGDIYKNFKGSK